MMSIRSKQTASNSTGGCKAFDPKKPINWIVAKFEESDTSESDSENSSEVEILPSCELPTKPEFCQMIFHNQNPLLIECVLAIVMKDFEFKDLQKFRLVHSTWKSVATGMLKWKYFLQFQYQFKNIPEETEDNVDHSDMQIQLIGWEPKVLECLKNAEHLKCDDFRISFQNIPASSKESIQNLNVSDHVHFHSVFQKVGSHLKRLELDACRFITTKSDKSYKGRKTVRGRRSRSYVKNPFIPHLTKNQDLINTLLSNKFPRLAHLAIRIGFGIPDYYEKQTKVEFGKFSTFPTVQHLEINLIYKSDSYGPFAEKLFKSAPNAKTLVIKNEELYQRSIDKNCKFVDQIYRKLELLPQLTSITINAHGYPSPEILKLLPAQAKVLDLLLPPGSNSWEIESFLQKHAPTLEALFLILPEEPESVLMPQFPKLKKLGLYHFQWAKNVMKFRFISDELFYGAQFPVIEELTLGNRFHCSDDEVMERWRQFMYFLPKYGFPAESIRVLKVPYIHIKDNEEYSLPAIKLMIRVGKMFPNVRQKYFAKCEKMLIKLMTPAPRPKSSRKKVNNAERE